MKIKKALYVGSFDRKKPYAGKFYTNHRSACRAMTIIRNKVSREINLINFLYGCHIPIKVTITAKPLPHGWVIESNLLYDGELVKHYPNGENVIKDIARFGLSL